MTDLTLQRVWESRAAISRRCGFDSRKLVQYYQTRQKMDGRNEASHQFISRHGKTNNMEV